MSITVSLRKDSVTLIPASLAARAIDAHGDGDRIQVTAYPGATVVVYPDGASVDEIERLTAAAVERAGRT